MNEHELKEIMTFYKGGMKQVPLTVFEINSSYILAVYQGLLSKFDIIVKYWQKIGDSWSRIRTPKHIHWAVDVLIKLQEDRNKT